MAHLSIRVLGPFQVSLAGEPVTGFASDKVRALLAYLALSPDRPHRRETLAGMLWPEFPERAARSSLRNALANLRNVLGERARSGDGSASPPFLHCTRQTIQFNGQSDHWLDAIAFEDLLAHLPATSEQLEQALSLARGPFLEGFTLADAAPFEEWLLLCREHLGRQVIEALDSLVAIYEAGGAYEIALAHARRRVELEPWQEYGQRQLMRLLARMGQRSEALTRYDRFCRSLREELGAEPSAETKALSEAILAGELAPEPTLQPGPSFPVWNFPALSTPFFGRADELAALEAMLAEPGTRLVSLTGLGGCGKTRLALEAGARLADRERRALAEQSPLTFAHGIVFVPLAALDSAEGLVPALADALQLRLEGGQEQLFEFLRRRQLLLIVDNLEQLLTGVEFLAQVLSAAPGVKILATSRERLQMQGEHALPLGGLPFPEHDPKCELPEEVDLDACLADYPALQLLVEGVQRVRPGYAPSPQEMPILLGICRLVDGLPLALELAASWADALSLNDILVEARRSLDFWRVDWPDLPERQRSMRAVFDASWRRLNRADQAAFSSLTVFRGGFALEAAEQVVAEAKGIRHLLAALVRKSFLQYDQARDRYRIHRLLRQFGAEKLARKPAREAGARDRHSTHYTRALQRWEADLVGARQQAALVEMEVESENIRAAWYWAVDQAQVERLDDAMEGLYHFYWRSGRYPEGCAAFQAAAGSAAEAESSAKAIDDKVTRLRVRARALAWQSNYQQALGQRDEARQTLQQCRMVLRAPAVVDSDTRLERAILAYCEGLTLQSVDFKGARQQFKESYGLFRDLGLRWGMASALTAWGNNCAIMGSHQDARQRLEEGLAIWRTLGNQSGVSISLGFLAYLARMHGRFEEAASLAREAYIVSLELGSRGRSGLSRLFYGVALEHLGEFSEAQAVIQEALALASDLGNRYRYTQVHSALVRIEMHRGRYKEARDLGRIGLALARENGPRFSVGLNLLQLGCLDLVTGSSASALEHSQDSIAVYREYGHTDDLSWGFAVVALAAHALGKVGEASQHLLHALEIAVDVGVVPPLLWALPAAALLLVDRGERERGVELYALTSRHPLVAESRWFADVAGNQLAEVAAALPSERFAVLEERGRTRDLGATVRELITELEGQVSTLSG